MLEADPNQEPAVRERKHSVEMDDMKMRKTWGRLYPALNSPTQAKTGHPACSPVVDVSVGLGETG
jgi:hypothetical protein